MMRARDKAVLLQICKRHSSVDWLTKIMGNDGGFWGLIYWFQ